MQVSLNEIKTVFNDLIQEKKPREQIANWALKRQVAQDADNLEYEPPEEEKIWEGISYLTGVDLKDMDGGYLHR